MPKYNGFKNWNHWNVSLWINNDEGLYRMALDFINSEPEVDTKSMLRGFPTGTMAVLLARYLTAKDRAAKNMLDALHDMGITHTPDGAPYSVSSIRAAMVGM